MTELTHHNPDGSSSSPEKVVSPPFIQLQLNFSPIPQDIPVEEQNTILQARETLDTQAETIRGLIAGLNVYGALSHHWSQHPPTTPELTSLLKSYHTERAITLTEALDREPDKDLKDMLERRRQGFIEKAKAFDTAFPTSTDTNGRDYAHAYRAIVEELYLKMEFLRGNIDVATTRELFFAQEKWHFDDEKQRIDTALGTTEEKSPGNTIQQLEQHLREQYIQDLRSLEATLLPNKHIHTLTIKNPQPYDLEELMKEKFIDIMHDLRTPLTAMSGKTQICRPTPKAITTLVDLHHTFLERINREVREKQDYLLKDLMPLEVKSVTKIQEEIEEFLPTLQKIHEKLTITFDKGLLDPEMHAPISMLFLESVLTNMITNAIKATPGNPDVVIRLERSHSGGFQFFVGDNGVGWDERIFDLNQEKGIDIFKQGVSSWKTGASGTGVGLHGAAKRLDKVGGNMRPLQRYDNEGISGGALLLTFPKEIPEAQQKNT